MDPLDPDLRAALAERFPATFPPGDLDANGPIVPVQEHLALASLLKEHGYTQYVSVIAAHFPAPAATEDTPAPVDTYEVATVLRRPAKGASIAFWWRVRLAEGQGIPTLFPLFAGADWQEREQYDLVGVLFEGHPDPRRLMLPEDWEGHPLRKGYAIDTPHAPWR